MKIKWLESSQKFTRGLFCLKAELFKINQNQKVQKSLSKKAISSNPKWKKNKKSKRKPIFKKKFTTKVEVMT